MTGSKKSFMIFLSFKQTDDVFMESSPCARSNNPVVRPVMRRTSSDSIGTRLRKISFEIGYGRRHSDELAPGELKGLPEVH